MCYGTDLTKQITVSIKDTLLKMKVLKRFFTTTIEEPFLSYNEPFSQRFFKKTSVSYFYNLKNLLSPQRTYCETKCSSDVKVSLWNHLDKKVFLGIAKQLYF